MESIHRELPAPAKDRFPTPHLEVLTRPAETAPRPRLPWYRARRLQIFAAVVLLVLVPGLAWDFLRPPQYRAAATVITAATPIPDDSRRLLAGPPTADVQHSAIQTRVLLGQELMARTLERVEVPGGDVPLDPDGLRDMLGVTPVPDTQLVELSAVGGEPEGLAAVVNAWIAAYQDQRREAVEREVGDARDSLRDEHESLGGTIEAKRAELDAFRAEHDIVTLERDGNESVARLRALNEDLNRARD
jgi:polysaccharide biosynthesis transport protein